MSCATALDHPLRHETAVSKRWVSVNRNFLSCNHFELEWRRVRFYFEAIDSNTSREKAPLSRFEF